MATNILDLPKLKDYLPSIEPIWGDDAGRESMEGQYSGTFVGYFTKLSLSFGRCTQAELYQIKQVLQKPLFELIYPDPDTTSTQTYQEQFYGTAIKPKRKSSNGKYEAFTVNVVGTQRKDNANMEG